jgi:hypothetical protein
MRRLFIATLCLLASMPLLKFADVQPDEIFMLAWFGGAVIIAMRKGWHPSIPKPLWRLGQHYLLFLGLVLLLAILNLRLRFYLMPNVSPLKSPGLVSIGRIVQLALAMTAQIAIAAMVGRDRRLLSFFVRAYITVGLISAVYGALSYAAMDFLGYGGTLGVFQIAGAESTFGLLHARGFFVEGGPFGIYLASVIMMALFRRYTLREGTRGGFWITMTILTVGLALSMSKAAICIVTVVALWHLFAGHRVRIRYVVVGAAALGAVIYFTNIVAGIGAYWEAVETVEKVVAAHPTEGSVVEGRLAGVFIVPRMIADHPITGVGIGDYAQERNNPVYEGDFPDAPDWDQPGLGLYGYVAELGIPLTLYLVFILWLPVRRVMASIPPDARYWLPQVAGLQLIGHLFGSPITFLYPWLPTAAVLGFLAASSQFTAYGAPARAGDDFNEPQQPRRSAAAGE